MRELLVSPLGFLIGLSLGALGGGGSILAVPVLVYLAGQSAKQATATSLVLVGVSAFVGIVPHWRAGRVRLGRGVVFGIAGIGGSLLGSHWNEVVDPDVLLLAFSGIMLVAAAGMYRRTRASAPATDDTEHHRTSVGTVIKVLLAGSLVGLLTGFFGVGGGFVIVPALVLALGFAMPTAVGTSLLVIGINAVVALSTRLQGGFLEWGVIVPFTVASIAGVLVGSRLAGTHNPKVLQQWFVVLLVAVAVYTAARSANSIW